ASRVGGLCRTNVRPVRSRDRGGLPAAVGAARKRRLQRLRDLFLRIIGPRLGRVCDSSHSLGKIDRKAHSSLSGKVCPGTPASVGRTSKSVSSTLRVPAARKGKSDAWRSAHDKAALKSKARSLLRPRLTRKRLDTFAAPVGPTVRQIAQPGPQGRVPAHFSDQGQRPARWSPQVSWWSRQAAGPLALNIVASRSPSPTAWAEQTAGPSARHHVHIPQTGLGSPAYGVAPLPQARQFL